MLTFQLGIIGEGLSATCKSQNRQNFFRWAMFWATKSHSLVIFFATDLKDLRRFICRKTVFFCGFPVLANVRSVRVLNGKGGRKDDVGALQTC